ncbi:MAG TPA: M14 family zinc carboxypeptidase [Myxococcota bacterium]|nr:M14 family zinc carboxypeptidase [Myxococcota bacterium]
MSFASLWLAAFALAQDPAPAPVPAPVPAAATETAPAPGVPSFAALPRDARGRVEEQAWLAALEALARAYPETIERLTIGKSAQGRELCVLALGERSGPERDRRPAFFATLDPRSPFAASAPSAALSPPASLVFLDAVQELCAHPSETWTRFVKGSALYLIVLPEPDRGLHAVADEGGAGPSVDLAHDFPQGWDAREGAASGQGPYPLSRAESRAIAGFLQRRTNIACAILLAREGERPVAAGAPEGPRAPGANMRKLGERELALLPASLERFAASELLLPVLLLEVAPAGQLSSSDPAALVAKRAGALPHLVAGPLRIERLSNSTWLVDVPVRNAGFFSSAGEGQRPGTQPRALWLKLAGARWISAACKTGERASYEELPLRAPPLFLEPLAGGEECTLRLVLEAQENANLVLDFDSLRAGSLHLEQPLVTVVAGGK